MLIASRSTLRNKSIHLPTMARTISTKPLYASQTSIPKLPVPSLPSTLNKYIETITPLLTPSELEKSTAHVKHFLTSPLSATLQARLEARASERPSWLSEWWNEAAYMGFRDRVIPHVNYYYLHKKGLSNGASQERRAAELVRATREFRDMVVQGLLEPEKAKGKPLCSASYVHMFGTSRIPAIPSDSFNTYPSDQSEHIIVLRKNRFFKVDTKGRGADEIEQAMAQIKSMVGDKEGLNLGALTSENRDVWTELRTHLLAISPKNITSLQAIESSILLVSLDDKPAYESSEERSWALWAGGKDATAAGKAENRWFDKHCLIVDVNGETGFNGEHSLLDGTPTLRWNEFMLASIAQNKIPLEYDGSEKAKGKLSIEEVTFDFDSKIKQGIQTATSAFAEVMGQHELVICQYDQYGKDLIKQHKCSPDAWAQMVKQLAYGKMTGGQPAVTYESAQTRKFLLGRTEVIRSASKESKNFVDSVLGESSDTERSRLFRAAAARHVQYSAWAADGQGVDRHMFGLKKLLRAGEEMPEMFKDPAFAKSSHWVLSTSQLGSDYLDGWGYGQVVPDGFGVSYSIGNDHLRWTITTTTGKAGELKKNLEWAAGELRRLMESAAKQEKAKL